MFNILSIGDATMDTFIEVNEATLLCKIQKDKCLLCLDYASKIPIHEFVKKVAGNAANNAVGCSRLGMRAGFWTILGDDETAQEVLKAMRKESVSTKYVHIQKNTKSNFTIVLNYKGERTQLVYHQPRDYKLPKIDKAEWVYLTAMGEKHHFAYEDLLKYVIKNNVYLAYNPGKEQIKCAYKHCIDLFSFTHVLFANKEEAKLILKTKSNGIKTLLKGLKNLGPHIVVITDGIKGSYVLDSGEYYHCPILKGPLVERTGAGDAYATGFIAALHYNKHLKEAMSWGTFNAWGVVQHIGPQDGLLTLQQMQRVHKKHPTIKGKKMK